MDSFPADEWTEETDPEDDIAEMISERLGCDWQTARQLGAEIIAHIEARQCP